MAPTVDSDSLLSTVARGSTVVFFGLIFELGISFIAKLLIANYLGRVDYGAISLGIATMSLLTTFLLSGLTTGISRYLPRYESPRDRRGILVSGFGVGLPYGLLVGALTVYFAPWIAEVVFRDPSIMPVLRIFGFVIPLAVFIKLAIGTTQGLQYSHPKVAIQNFTLPLVRFLGVVVVLYLGLDLLGVAWAYLASYAAAALVGVYFVHRYTNLMSRGAQYTSRHRELLSFSLPLVFATSMTFVFAQVDMLLLGFFSDTGDVGVYNVVYPIAQLLLVGLSSVEFIFLPVISELHSIEASEEMKRLYQLVTKWLFSLALPVFLVFAFFPTMSIKITFGAEYLAGAGALSVLSVGFFLHTVLGPNEKTLTSIGKTTTVMYYTTFAALLNLVLNVILIPPYAFFGAAVATAVSYVVLSAMFGVRLYRDTGIQPFSRGLVIPGLIGGLTVATIYVLTVSIFRVTIPLLVAMFVVFILLYGVAVLRFGIDDAEIMLVLRFEDRFDVDLEPFKRVVKVVMDIE